MDSDRRSVTDLQSSASLCLNFYSYDVLGELPDKSYRSIVDIVNKMMEKDPLKRSSASELLEEDIMGVSSRESSASSRQRNGLLYCGKDPNFMELN